jgi:hypothetical protein
MAIAGAWFLLYVLALTGIDFTHATTALASVH